MRGQTAAVGVIRGVRTFMGNSVDWHIRTYVIPAGGASFDAIADWQADAVIHNGRLAESHERLCHCVRGPIINTADTGLGVPTVCPDMRRAGQAMAEYLLNLGCDHLVSLLRPVYWGTRANQRWQAGITDCAQRLGVEPIHLSCRPHGNTFTEDDHPLLGMLRSLGGAVGLMVCDDETAHTIANACVDAGISVPDDVAILSMGNDEYHCSTSNPSLSSLGLPHEQVGHRAAALVHAALAGESLPTKPIRIAPLQVVPRASCSVSFAEDETVKQAMAYMEDHLHEGIRIDDVLDHLQLSRKSLEVRFREARNRTPHAELQYLRVRRAKRLIASTNMGLDDIALSCGFGSGARFSVVFRQHVDMTPSQFRKQHQSRA